MVVEVETAERIGCCEYGIGTRAIVFTGTFRCLAVLEDDGEWHEAYGTGQPLNVVRVIETLER